MSTLVVLLATLAAVPTTQPMPNGAGMAIYAGDELLIDYRPRSTLVTPETRLEKPKFPAIDVHCHWPLQTDSRLLLTKMDELGLSHAINLSGGSGPECFAMLQRFVRGADGQTLHDGRLLVFANIDFKGLDDADWPERTRAFLVEAHSRGASGVKIFKNLGLNVRDAAGALVAVDDPRLDVVWQTCGKLGIPVLIHAGDPVAFFQPLDATNERWMQLHRFPDWHITHVAWRDVIEQRNRMIARHPHTNFIVAHMAEGAHDYDTLGRWLEAMPNMSIDLSARENEIGRQPYRSHDFFVRHADRILFGSDRYPGRPDQPRHRIYYRMLETRDEHFDYYDHPFAPMGEWRIYGIDLPDDVLEKVYRTNAARLLGIEVPR